MDKCKKYVTINNKKILITKDNMYKVAQLALGFTGQKVTKKNIETWVKDF